MIEVKIVVDIRTVVNVVTELKNRISLFSSSSEKLSVLLAIVFDDAVKYSGNVRQSLEKIAGGSKIPIKIRLYSLPELEAEVGLTAPSIT